MVSPPERTDSWRSKSNQKKFFLKKLIDLELCVVTIPENKNIVYLEMGRITKWYLRMCLYNWGAVWKLKHAK